MRLNQKKTPKNFLVTRWDILQSSQKWPRAEASFSKWHKPQMLITFLTNSNICILASGNKASGSFIWIETFHNISYSCRSCKQRRAGFKPLDICAHFGSFTQWPGQLHCGKERKWQGSAAKMVRALPTQWCDKGNLHLDSSLD